ASRRSFAATTLTIRCSGTSRGSCTRPPRRRALRRTRGDRTRCASARPVADGRRRDDARAHRAALRRLVRVQEARPAPGPRTILMPSWGAVVWGIVASAVLAVVLVRFALRERRPSVLFAGATAALVAPLL